MSRWVAALPLIVLAALALLFVGYALHRNPHVEPQALVGKPMPDVSLPSLDDGTMARLRDETRQGPVLVNFFASWCAPCAIEHPVLMQMQARKARIVGIAYEDVPPRGSPDATRAFLARLGDPFVARLMDRDGRAGIEFGVTGVPETYLIGQNGQILAKHTGPLSEEDAKALMDRALTGR